MTAVIESLRAQPWVTVAILMAAFVVLLGVLTFGDRMWAPNPELTRKTLHAVSGFLTLTFPYVFTELWPVILLTGGSGLILSALKFIPPIRRHFGRVTGGVGRTTLGEIYFPLSVALVFWLSLGSSPLLFVIPILVLTIADTTGALVGVRYGLNRFTGAAKSLEGSVAFVVAAFFCIHVPLLLWTNVGRTEALLMAMTMSLLVMLLEGSGWRGLDNLFIPIGGFFLLRAYLPLGVDELLGRFLVTFGLVGAIALSRRSSTLVDDSLLAGAFLCYVTWALAGWRWLVPPAIVFLGYAWFSPRTPENSRRIHGIAAIGAVWIGAVFWLALATARRDSSLFYPFTLVFACHLAIFGLSRLAYDYPRQSVATLTTIAILKSWALVFAPFVLIEGATTMNLLLAVLAAAAIATATIAFERTEPGIRSTPLDLWRWGRQAASAFGGSVIGWIVMTTLDWIA